MHTRTTSRSSLSVSGAAGLSLLIGLILVRCGDPDPAPPPVDTGRPTTSVSTTVTNPTTTVPPSTVPPSTTTTTAAPTTTSTAAMPSTTTSPATTTTSPSTTPPTTTAPPPATEPPPPTPPPPPATEPPPPATQPPTAPATTAPPPTEPPPTEPPPPVTEPPTPTAGGVASPAVVDLTNQQRAAAGLAPLSTDGALTAAAIQHSSDQAGRDSMGHTGSDGSSAGQRIAANGGSFSTWGENVAAGYGSAASVVDGWMNSPGHRDNILSPAFTRIGVGVAYAADGTPYWTMVLAG